MVVLGVDTATSVAAVAATDDGRLLREGSLMPVEGERPRHGEILLAEIERTVDEIGGWERVDRIAVGIGPGSFTGLRIGIATARALAQARGLAIAPVGSLEVLGRGILESGGESMALPVFDAKRGEAFAALFSAGGECVWKPSATPPGELAERVRGLSRPVLAAGEGSLRFAAELKAAGATVASPEDPVHRIAARWVCELGEASTEAPPEQIRPLYLRPPDAKRWLDRDRGNAGR